MVLVCSSGAVLSFGRSLQLVVDSQYDLGLGAGPRPVPSLLPLRRHDHGSGWPGPLLPPSPWIGERVVADIRTAVFGRVLGLDLGFFETNRTGEIIST